jgi:hypothetical protein
VGRRERLRERAQRHEIQSTSAQLVVAVRVEDVFGAPPDSQMHLEDGCREGASGRR